MLFSEPLPDLLLTAPRLVLRPPQRADYRDWAILRGQSRAFLEPWEPLWPSDALSRTCYRRRLKRAAEDWREDAGYAFHLIRREDQALLGALTFTNVRRGVAQAASVGYWIGEPHARQGYMREALRTALDFAFADLGLHRVEAACLPRNTASAGLLDRCGFQREGIARKYLKIAGRWEDHLLFAILREDAGR
ncbi:MAG: GNAT family protein [Alphaproteobacteria bacterium]|nr:GNAT family protein [Alphaproteobacteria bacterium]